MSHHRSTSTTTPREKTYFEQQREELISEIAISFEHVLSNINKLNRSLEAVITVGNEFSAVEALWSQFEAVMAKDPEEAEAETETKSEEGETTVDQSHSDPRDEESQMGQER